MSAELIPDAVPIEGELVDAPPAEFSRYAPIDMDTALRRFVHIAEGDLVFDLDAPNRAHATMTRREFEAAFAHSRVEIAKNKRGDLKVVQVPKQWLTDPGKQIVRGLRYNPLVRSVVFTQDGEAWCNSFWMPRWQRQKLARYTADVERFLAHIELIVPVKEERDVVLDWVAHHLQCPGLRPRFALMMVARYQGTGRGWIVGLLKEVLGVQNVKPFSMREFESDFDDAFVECLLNVVEEVKEATEGKYTLGEKLKDRISQVNMVANIKFGAKRLMRVYSGLLMQSNHPDAIVIRGEDRRVMVVATDAEPRDDAYYLELYRLLEDSEFIESIATYLLERDLTSFHEITRAPMTRAKLVMIAAAESEVDTVVQQFIEECPEPYFISRHIDEFIDVLSEETGQTIIVPSGQQLGAILHRIADRVPGLDPRAGMKFQGRKERPWKVRQPGSARKADLETVRASLDRVGDWLKKRKADAYDAKVTKWSKSKKSLNSGKVAGAR